MTPDQIVNVVTQYTAVLQARGCRARKAETSIPNSIDEKLDHAVWMCEQIFDFVKQSEWEKAARWLGFIQGVLYSHDIRTIDQMRDDNR